MRIQTYLREERPDGSFNIEGYIQNITDIQHRRNDINTLTHAINNAKESIFAARPDGTIIFANRRFLHNHGIPESEDISQLKIYNVAADMPTQEAWNERCTKMSYTVAAVTLWLITHLKSIKVYWLMKARCTT